MQNLKLQAIIGILENVMVYLGNDVSLNEEVRNEIVDQLHKICEMMDNVA